ncbi:hypothetical protein TSAR_000330 [Trichomalopsis sarcophagae]|uniref:Uncharacterized protein n=1 Tax=Trichomalopsis sarcophagae TaxID=543379 RepID=A0A232F440_9HYME|nr:hypothetical protein TSAR_000330 [Trichomalopsis sarcophagae]
MQAGCTGGCLARSSFPSGRHCPRYTPRAHCLVSSERDFLIPPFTRLFDTRTHCVSLSLSLSLRITFTARTVCFTWTTIVQQG